MWPYLEPCWTPVYELDGLVDLDGRYGRVHVLGDHVPPVQQAHGHILREAINITNNGFLCFDNFKNSILLRFNA